MDHGVAKPRRDVVSQSDDPLRGIILSAVRLSHPGGTWRKDVRAGSETGTYSPLGLPDGRVLALDDEEVRLWWVRG